MNQKENILGEIIEYYLSDNVTFQNAIAEKIASIGLNPNNSLVRNVKMETDIGTFVFDVRLVSDVKSFMVEQMLKKQFFDIEKEKHELGNIGCPICYEKPNLTIKTTCGHIFCYDCVNKTKNVQFVEVNLSINLIVIMMCNYIM